MVNFIKIMILIKNSVFDLGLVQDSVLMDQSNHSSPPILPLLCFPFFFPSAPGNQSPSADIPGSGAMHGISLSDLTAMGQQEQKHLLGERLYLSVMTIDPLFHDLDLVGKITGMLLELNNADIFHLLESPDALHKKVQEAIAVLEANQQKDSTTSELSAAAMAPPTRRVHHTAVARNRTAVQGVQCSMHHSCAPICCTHLSASFILG